MKHLYTLGFLLGGILWAFSQNVTLLDQQNGNPIEGAVLLSENPSLSAVTNARGQAELSAFAKANRIEIRSLGYRSRYLTYDEIQKAGGIVRLSPSTLDLDQVVVSATRWNQLSGQVPLNIVTVSPQEVALQNPQTAADLLGISGKVFIQKSQQGGGSPMIRGFSANRLVYTVDGVRMNTAIFRSGNLQNVINLDPFAIERTEVLLGPGSVIYGSDAIGGVMSFRTLTPQLSLNDEPLISGKANARYSSANNERTGHLDLNVGGRQWAFLTSFSSWDFDDLKQGSYGPEEYLKEVFPQRQNGVDVVITQDDSRVQVPSAYSQINLMQKIRFSPNENWEVGYGFHYSETSPYGRYDRHNRLRNGTLRYAEWNYGPQKWAMHNLSLTHNRKQGLYDKLSLRLAQQYFEESRIDRDLNNEIRNTQLEKVNAWSANLDLVKKTGRRNTLFYGLEYVANHVNSTGVLRDVNSGVEETGPSRYPESDWQSLAAYVNTEFRPDPRLTLQSGLRYNRFRLESDFTNNLEFYPFPFDSAELNHGALTGSAGAVYRPVPLWTFKANVGTAFRSPNVDDLGKVFDSEPGAVTVPNPDLEAEYAYSIDLGIARVFGEVATLEVSAYYTRLHDAMVRRDFQLNGQDSIPYNGELSQVQAIQNAAVTEVTGLQASLALQLPSGFSFLTDLNLQQGDEELDDGTTSPSRHAAPFFGISRLQYQHEGLTLEFNAAYQGERRFDDLAVEERAKDEIYAKDENGNNFAPSWYTLNIKALYRLSEAFSLSGGLENLTDQRYRPYSSGISGAGRNFVLALNARF